MHVLGDAVTGSRGDLLNDMADTAMFLYFVRKVETGSRLWRAPIRAQDLQNIQRRPNSLVFFWPSRAFDESSAQSRPSSFVVFPFRDGGRGSMRRTRAMATGSPSALWGARLRLRAAISSHNSLRVFPEPDVDKNKKFVLAWRFGSQIRNSASKPFRRLAAGHLQRVLSLIRAIDVLAVIKRRPWHAAWLTTG